ncbi:MAG TPA: PAS domain S-box protein, partial [bacterium]|nr:PAS domain S-box protein [bacterium]
MQRRIFVHLISLAFLAIAGITAIAAYHIRTGTIRYHVETFSKVAEEVHHNMGRLLAGAVSDVALISNNPLFRGGATDPKTMEAALHDIHKILPRYDDISLIAPNGTVIASTSYRFLADWRHKKHFQASLRGAVAVSPVSVSSEPFRQFLQFTSPVSQNGTVKAVISLQLDLAKIAEIPLGVHIGETGNGFVTDHTGNIIIHHDPRRILEPMPVEFASAGQGDGVFFTENGSQFFGNMFAPSPEDTIFPAEIPPWRVVIAERSEELLSAARLAILQAILFAAAIFVVAVLVSLQLSRRIVRPLGDLTTAMADISGTELSVSLPPPTNDEIGALSRTFLRLLEDLRESRALLVSSEKRYREMADLLPLPLFEADLSGKIRYVNRVAFETFGYSEEDIARGVSMFDVLVPEDRPRAMKNVEGRLNGTLVNRIEYTARRKDGTTLPVMVYNAPFHEHERVAGLRGVVIDLSPIREAEEELSHKEQQLMQAQKMESIGTLVGGLAHDFNNVLGGIGATSSLLTYMNEHDPSAVTPDKLRESLGLIDDQVKRASEMIRKLLTLSRRQKISFLPMDLVRSVQNVAIIAEKTLDKSVRLRLSLPATPALINGDGALLEQVILNLVLNAWHAMTIMRREGGTPGGVCAITLERTDIGEGFPNWPPGLSSGPYWSLRVTDTGVG